MEQLYNKLLLETEPLKEIFIKKTVEWANNNYGRMAKMSYWTQRDWCEYFGLTPQINKNNVYLFPNGFYNTKDSKTHSRMCGEIRRILSKGLDEYVKSEVTKAEQHYENSILKLTDRLLKKGLDIDKIEILTSSVGVNIDTTLTDGNKTVRAYTIVAEGEIQRPHYRYLIK